ncbi:hypothetical protein C8J56DRAFT_1066150 [Mycena floridula]|nr:hypothetical protein C8J56DRAFT_1066150 [Mycena floridula]
MEHVATSPTSQPPSDPRDIAQLANLPRDSWTSLAPSPSVSPALSSSSDDLAEMIGYHKFSIAVPNPIPYAVSPYQASLIARTKAAKTSQQRQEKRPLQTPVSLRGCSSAIFPVVKQQWVSLG